MYAVARLMRYFFFLNVTTAISVYAESSVSNNNAEFMVLLTFNFCEYYIFMVVVIFSQVQIRNIHAAVDLRCSVACLSGVAGS